MSATIGNTFPVSHDTSSQTSTPALCKPRWTKARCIKRPWPWYRQVLRSVLTRLTPRSGRLSFLEDHRLDLAMMVGFPNASFVPCSPLRKRELVVFACFVFLIAFHRGRPWAFLFICPGVRLYASKFSWRNDHATSSYSIFFWFLDGICIHARPLLLDLSRVALNTSTTSWIYHFS